MAMNRKYDIVVFGATSSVGVEIVKYLAHNSPCTWCIAGRRAKPLEAIAANAAKISGTSPPDILIADVSDGSSLEAMALKCKVVLTTVGPYAKFGEGVIEACISSGTNYVDITGEVPWVSKMKQKYQGAANKAGIHVLSFCGYDSIPSELGVYLAGSELTSNGGLAKAESFHFGAGGGFPAGTVETIILGVSQGRDKILAMCTKKPKIVKKREGEGEGVVPASEQAAVKRSFPSPFSLVQWSSAIKAFTPVGFMSAINTPVVHGAAAKLGYGGLHYSERFLMADLSIYQSPLTLFGLIPSLMTLFGYFFLGLCTVLGILRPVSKLVNFAIKGQKPDTKVTIVGTSKDGKMQSTVTLQYPGDPGILFTAFLSIQCALALANGEADIKYAGFSTPTIALRKSLPIRLKKAGMVCDVTKTGL